MSSIMHFMRKGKLKKAHFSNEMLHKEFEIGKRDLLSAKASFEAGNYKWATIQSYYAIFHAVRALAFKAGYRERSHTALKFAFKELYVDKNILDYEIYKTLERGMDLREMADYKETFSENGAEHLLIKVQEAIEQIEEYLK